MSKSSDIRVALGDLVETNLTAYVQLPDSIESDDNPNIQLDKGYSVSVGPAEKQNSVICRGTTGIQRTFVVVLTNSYIPGLQADLREGLENDLLDDVETMVDVFEINNTLGGLSVNSQYVDDSGIEYLTTDRKQFILIAMTVTVDYFQ